MLEQLYSLEVTLDTLLDYVYPPVDVSPVLLLSQLDYRAQQKERLAGMHTAQQYTFLIICCIMPSELASDSVSNRAR